MMMRRAAACRMVFAIGALWTVTFGSVAGAAEPIPLRAGPLSMVFDTENAFLRYVKVGRHEVLRGVNAPIRDQNWGTVRPKVSNVRVDDEGNHFSIDFDAVCQQGDIDFRWHGRLVGTQSGEVTFTFDGEAHSTFSRSRIGICVLHPASAAGKPWIIRHVNGDESKGSFPTHISPHQPAKQIRGISHEFADKVWAHVDMEGDVFEMEDQRNWTDASFKTYCTPLELPFPLEVKQSTKIAHKIRIRVYGELAEAKPPKSPPADEPVVLTLSNRTAKLPRIGLQVSSEANDLSQRQLARLNELRLDHLRVDLAPSEDGFAAKLRAASDQSRALGIPLHVGIRLGDRPRAEMQPLVDELKTLAPNVAVFLVHVTDWRQFEPVREALLPVRGKALIGAARGDNFVDLNRDRPNENGLELVAMAMNPQIHAFDDMSLIETLPIQGDAVRSARMFLGKRRLAVGPITLRPPPAKPADNKTAPRADVDVRQPQPFTAAWTLGSLKYLAEAEAPSVTYFETVGRKGLMGLDPAVGQAAPKGGVANWIPVFPAYHVLREVADFAGGDVRYVDSSEPLAAVALALQKQSESRVIVANLTGRQRSVAIQGLRSPREVALLHDRKEKPRATMSDLERNTDDGELVLKLRPHAIVRIDVSSD